MGVNCYSDCIYMLGNMVDYDSGPYTVVIPTGNDTGILDVSITDDDVLEMNEIFQLSIESTSLPSKVFPSRTSRNPSMTTVYIIDDDSQGKH